MSGDVSGAQLPGRRGEGGLGAPLPFFENCLSKHPYSKKPSLPCENPVKNLCIVFTPDK